MLFEKPGRHAGQLVGRSPYLQGVHAAAPPERIGEIVRAAILAAEANSLAGAIIGRDVPLSARAVPLAEHRA